MQLRFARNTGLGRISNVAERLVQVYHSGQFLVDGKGAQHGIGEWRRGATHGAPVWDTGHRTGGLAQWRGAGYMLGDLGADVIKIEQPVTGDPSRGVTQAFGHNLEIPGGRALWFEMVNRGKRAITLNLKSAQGKEVLRRLISKADVFFTNFTMDVVERLAWTTRPFRL